MRRLLAAKRLMFATLIIGFAAQAMAAEARLAKLRDVVFTFENVTGVGAEEGICRRDPSDVIKVGHTYYVWYTKVVRDELPENLRFLYPSGYPGTIWYATSTDQGRSWKEQSRSLGLGDKGAFDSFGVFTPNILFAGGKYFLFYDAVQPTPGRTDGVFENNSKNDFTAIGLAVADSPQGPFKRVGNKPILTPNPEGTRFDSYRVDDAALMVRQGKVWLYYKGRNLADGPGGPRTTRMGVAVAPRPEGRYVKLNQGRAILDRSHEVLVWQHGEGVAALASISRTIQYAQDGLRFTQVASVDPRPKAPGLYRPELTGNKADEGGIRWGISMRDGRHPYLVRFELDSKRSVSKSR